MSNAVPSIEITMNRLIKVAILSLCLWGIPQATASVPQEIIDKVRTNEEAMELIRMDFERVVTARSYLEEGEMPEPLLTKSVGTWARDGMKQYLSIDWFYDDGFSSGRVKVFDGEKVFTARKGYKAVALLPMDRKFWLSVWPARLGYKVHGQWLSEALQTDRTSIKDGVQRIEDRLVHLVEIVHPEDPNYQRRLWIDSKRGIPLQIESYHICDTPPKLLAGFRDFVAYQLPNGGWIPIAGTRFVNFTEAGVAESYIAVDVDSISIDRNDIPDSLFTMDVPADFEIIDRRDGN